MRHRPAEMTKWNAYCKQLFAKLVLGDVVFEKRCKGPGEYSRARWFITLPLHAPPNKPAQGYINGPYHSKSAAVLRAAELMEII